MLTTLIASRPQEARATSGVVMSVVIHTALIAMAVAGSTRSVISTRDTPQDPPRIFFAPPPAAPSARTTRVTPAPQRPTARPIDETPPVLREHSPLHIPDAPTTVTQVSAPTIDPNAALTSAGGLFAHSQEGAATSGSGNAGEGQASPLTDDQVERAVQALRPVSPRYPDMLRAAGVTGTVRVRFVVDAEGRVEAESIEVLDATQEAFGEAVRRALLATRYRPAEASGRSVRQLVEQVFTFRLQR